MSKRSAYFPPPLQKGETIGLIAPARWPEPAWIKKCEKFLHAHGYKLAVHPQCRMKDGQLSGDDRARAKGLMDMFADPDIGAILCARGGANAIRILDKLDYGLIKRHPKPLIGFSDITLLLQAITKECGFVTYHGPMGWNFAHTHDRRTPHDFFAVLEGGSKRQKFFYPQAECVKPGKAAGRLTGGNITRLELLMGTPWDWSGQDSILLLEDVDEVLYKIDEKLCHLRLAGRFDRVRAILVGEMIDIGDGETGFARKGERRFGRSLRQILMENLPSHIPLCFDFPCGHGKYLTTLPIGADAKVAIDKRGVELVFGS